MTKTETAQLLTLIAAFDRRTIGETDVEAWHLIVADLEPDDCMTAVREHYTDSREWLMPADVRRRALAAARRRAGQAARARIDAEIAEAERGEVTDRTHPLRALMAGAPIKYTPRADWQTRRAITAAPREPFTAAELEAAAAALNAAAAEAQT